MNEREAEGEIEGKAEEERRRGRGGVKRALWRRGRE